MTLADKAFALLEAHRSGKAKLSRKAGSLAGQLVADPQPLTAAQESWMEILLQKAGLPPLGESGK